MLTHPAFAAFAAAALLAPALQALAYGDNWHDRHAREHRWERHDDKQHSHGPEKRLVEKYDRFAGSDRNARELVEGLRKDTEIELSTGGRKTTFKPATNQMGYGNVDLALGLAKASLAEHGIHKPAPEQIKAALNGGTVTAKSGQRVTLPGVLKLRASGMGWGQVAHKIGVKVGDVKRDTHAHKKHDDKHHHKHARHHDRDDDARHDHRKHAHSKHDKHDWKHDHKRADKHHRDHGDRHDHRKHAHHPKPDWKHQRHEQKHEHVKHHQQRPEFHRAKFERPERVQRPEKTERPHRPERPERPERHHHRR